MTAVAVVLEDGAAFDAAGSDMIPGSRMDYAKCAGHKKKQNSASSGSQLLFVML